MATLFFLERGDGFVVFFERADGDVIFWGRVMGNAGNAVFAMAEMERAGAPADDSENVVRAAGAEAGRATAVEAVLFILECVGEPAEDSAKVAALTA